MGGGPVGRVEGGGGLRELAGLGAGGGVLGFLGLGFRVSQLPEVLIACACIVC